MPTLFRRAAHRLTRAAAPHISLSGYRRWMPYSPVGFFYHAVSDEPLPHVRNLYPYKSAAEFEQDLLWLKHNTTPVGHAELAACLRAGKPLPKNAAYVTFDDGFAECFTVARPLLLKHGIPAIFFLTTDWIDNHALFYRSKASLIIEALHAAEPAQQVEIARRIANRFDLDPAAGSVRTWLKSRKQADENLLDEAGRLAGLDFAAFLAEKQPYLTRPQIDTLLNEGFSFGAHTRRHAKLADLAPADQESEIVESCRIVSRLTGEAEVPFAFPFSGDRVSRPMLAALRRSHPEIGLVFDTKKLRQEAGILHRIWADQPFPGVAPEENLAHWLHDAYARELSERSLG